MNKYHAKKIAINGIIFDSKREGERYVELRLLERAGELTQLLVHPCWLIEINGVKACTYEGDFSYRDRGGAFIVEDVKGVRTPIYRLKKKLLRATHGIEITEV